MSVQEKGYDRIFTWRVAISIKTRIGEGKMNLGNEGFVFPLKQKAENCMEKKRGLVCYIYGFREPIWQCEQERTIKDDNRIINSLWKICQSFMRNGGHV